MHCCEFSGCSGDRILSDRAESERQNVIDCREILPVAAERLVDLDIRKRQVNSPEKEHAEAMFEDRNQRPGVWQASKWQSISLGLLILNFLPVVAAFGVLYRQRLSVPYHDDYGVILAFANRYGQLHGFTAKVLDIATTQSNDYKLGFVHLIIAMELELTGHLNFAFLVTFGNLFLLAIAYLLWVVYRQNGSALNQQLLEFLPISLLFFSLTYWESVNWAMAGLQNLSVIMFSLLAMHLLVPKRAIPPSLPILLLACISAILAAFSSANGFLLAPVGLLMLVRRRAFVAAAVWCVSFGLPIAAYRYHYIPYHVSVDTMHRGSYIVKVCYVFAFLGCAIQQRWAAAILGFAIFGVLVLALRSGFERTHPGHFYFSVWIVLTAVPVAWLRHSIASRYSIYSLLLLISCYFFLARYLSMRSTALNLKRFYAVSIVLATILSLAGDTVAYVQLGRRREMVLSGIENYRANPKINSPMNDPRTKEADPKEEGFQRDTLNQAIAAHAYTLPEPD